MNRTHLRRIRGFHVFSVCVAGAAIALSAGCGSSDPPPAAHETRETGNTAFDPMLRQLDHAKEQADSLPDARKDALDRAIEADESR